MSGIARNLLNTHFSQILAILLLFLVPLPSCARLPKDIHPEPSLAIGVDTREFSQRIHKLAPAGTPEGSSGYVILDESGEAFQWRLALTDLAKKSLDVQYYIWNNDESGRILLSRLVDAADRGVRVRLLIDDTKMLGREKNAAILSLHPNIEIRAFNPFANRSGIRSFLELVADLSRLNHRMHNKMMVADKAAGITGGRNIGNEYFGMEEKANFRDMDLLAIGPAAAELSRSFDLFWNSEWAYPAKTLAGGKPDKKKYNKLKKKTEKRIKKDHLKIQSWDLRDTQWEELVAELPHRLLFGPSRVLTDKPGIKEKEQRSLVAEELSSVFNRAQQEVFISAPYFVPTRQGVNAFRNAVAKGVRIIVFTNSLASNDVAMTNGPYARVRKDLLEAGVELYEMRDDAQSRAFYSTPPIVSKHLGLHAKVMIFDRQKVFVGTMNLDPRSMIQNTEVGLLVDSPLLAGELMEAFSRDLLPENAWKVGLNEKGKVIWESSAGTLTRQPARNGWQRFIDWIFPSRLLEDQL